MASRSDLAGAWARALAAKDFDAARDLLADDVDFRALTPNRFWQETSAEGVAANVLPVWLEDSDEVETLDSVEAGEVADTGRVRYRLTVSNPEGRFVFEQEAYLRVDGERIAWLRILCSGFRPLAQTYIPG